VPPVRLGRQLSRGGGLVFEREDVALAPGDLWQVCTFGGLADPLIVAEPPSILHDVVAP